MFEKLKVVHKSQMIMVVSFAKSAEQMPRLGFGLRCRVLLPLQSTFVRNLSEIKDADITITRGPT